MPDYERRVSVQDLVGKIDDLKTDMVDRMARVEVNIEQLSKTTESNSNTVNDLKDKFSNNEGYVRGFFKFGSILGGIVIIGIAIIKFFSG